MHELAITQCVLDIALEQAEKHEASRVAKINLVVGDLSGVVEECVQFYFQVLSKDTVASEAMLEFERVPTGARCHACDSEFTLAETDWTCPKCGSDEIEIVGGRELYIDSMELE